MNRPYFQLVQNGNEANLNIYGDITSFPWIESDVSAYSLSQQLSELNDVDRINVYINSYGGEVAEGLAIYNALKRHPAQIVTYCDGMACSIASVIFMAGDERIMSNPSFLMIHDAWTNVYGANAAELRKQADDIEKITTASVKAYMERINIDEEKLRELMTAESWLTHEEALEMGFATSVEEAGESKNASQSAKQKAFNLFCAAIKTDNSSDDDKAAEESEEQPDNKHETPEDEGNEETGEKPKNEAAQKLCGFFNALLSE